MAKKMAKNSEELEHFKGEVDAFSAALNNKKNWSYKDDKAGDLIADLTARLITGDASEKDIDVVSMISVQDGMKQYLSEIREGYLNKANTQGIFSYNWDDVKAQVKEQLGKLGVFRKKGTTKVNEELLEVHYKRALKGVVSVISKIDGSVPESTVNILVQLFVLKPVFDAAKTVEGSKGKSQMAVSGTSIFSKEAPGDLVGYYVSGGVRSGDLDEMDGYLGSILDNTAIKEILEPIHTGLAKAGKEFQMNLDKVNKSWQSEVNVGEGFSPE